MANLRTANNQESASGGSSGNSTKELYFPNSLSEAKNFMPYIKFTRHEVVPLVDPGGNYDIPDGESGNVDDDDGSSSGSYGSNIPSFNGTGELIDPVEKSVIKLFIPPAVTEQNSAIYDKEEMPFFQSMVNGMGENNDVAMTLQAQIKAMKDSEKGTGEKVLAGIDAAALVGSAAFTSQLRKLFTSNTLFRAGTGRAANPQVTYLFKTVSNRAFSFQFVMVPMNNDESKMIRDIIREFKSIMYPQSATGFTRATGAADTGRDFYLKAPDIIRVRYYYGSAEHNWMHKFKDCVVTDVNVEYGGQTGAWTQFSSSEDTNDGGAPTQVTLSINFEEISIVTQQDVNERGM